MKLLFLSASPTRTEPIDDDVELRRITGVLQSAEHRDWVVIEAKLAIQRSELQHVLRRAHAEVVHFSGHGTLDRGILLEDDEGEPALVPPEALADIVRRCAPEAKLVVLNACFSADQAAAIASHIAVVVGATADVRDDHAITFAEQLYQALFDGVDVKSAYDIAVQQVRFDGDEAAAPFRLVSGTGVDPSAIRPITEPAGSRMHRARVPLAALAGAAIVALVALLGGWFLLHQPTVSISKVVQATRAGEPVLELEGTSANVSDPPWQVWVLIEPDEVEHPSEPPTDVRYVVSTPAQLAEDGTWHAVIGASHAGEAVAFRPYLSRTGAIGASPGALDEIRREGIRSGFVSHAFPVQRLVVEEP